MPQFVASLLLLLSLLLNGCVRGTSREYREAVERETRQTREQDVAAAALPPVPAKRPEAARPRAEYTQDGVAGWVGKGAPVRTTASGELYDPYELTAAHRTLPFGVYISIRNQETGREIVAKVNDRGPYVKYRVLDLSLAAAQRLGIGSGAKVRIHALGFRRPGNPNGDGYREPETYDQGNFAVQVGSFKNEKSAKSLVDRLSRLFPRVESRKGLENGALVHQVLVGRYASLKAAEEAEKKFGAHGYPQCFVISLD